MKLKTVDSTLIFSCVTFTVPYECEDVHRLFSKLKHSRKQFTEFLEKENFIIHDKNIAHAKLTV